jgi:integrase/recombinase XerD
MLISEAFRVFVVEKKVNGLADRTLEYYNDTVGKFVEFCGERDLETASGEINAYFLLLQDRGLAQNSVLAHWRGIKVFWGFVFAEGYIEKMPKLPTIREEKRQIKPLSLGQVRQVLDSFYTANFIGLRNQTIIRLMFDSGVRLKELAGISLRDVDLTQRWMLVEGKGKKDRWLPFGESTKRQLWSYLKQREKYAVDAEGALFIKLDGSRLTPRGIQIMFRRLAKEMSFEGIRLSPHTVRHSFALNWIEGGGDPFSLQKILGHTSQAMTSRYVAMAKETIKNQHNRFSPGDRI